MGEQGRRKRRNPAAGGASEPRFLIRVQICEGEAVVVLSIRLVLYGTKANCKGNDSLLGHMKSSFFLHRKPALASVR
ncbi:hypothetical protein KSP39_PZI007984 [Platanthera zijinensis]|uniref:Uncharacterized protein n=1 Tax=Platanthera zijinensis TaxID=2320716 RepID=A0AAP0BQC6_9ASPA